MNNKRRKKKRMKGRKMRGKQGQGHARMETPVFTGHQ
jgi:hypothetical protein